MWTFFEGEEVRECLICRYVSHISAFSFTSLIIDRQTHAANPRHQVKKFSKSTSTGVLRKHLYENHLDLWVAGCDQLKITVKAKEAKKYVDDYRARKQHTAASASDPEPPELRTQFSQEAFVDAIVEFIVGDDQVRCIYFI